MKKDYKRILKNCLLVFLISLSFFLVSKLWSVGNYFGDGLSKTFSDIVDVIKTPFEKLFDDEEKSSFENLKYVLSPKRIVANFEDKRSIMLGSDSDFYMFYEKVLEILRGIELGDIKIESVEKVSSDDYYASLKSKSVLVDYDSLYDYSLVEAITDVSGQSKLMQSTSIIREIIVSMSDNVLNYTALYMRDYNDGTVYKFMLSLDKTALEQMLIERLVNNPLPGTYFYSYELNFHVDQNTDGSPAKVVFYPMTSVALVPEERQVITSYRHGADGEELKNEAEILKLFNINVMTSGKYTDLDGSRNFVEKNATLKIGADGFLEYSSTEGGKGIELTKLKESQNFDIGLATISASAFVRNIFNLIPQSENAMLRISGDLSEGETQGSYTLRYDYYIGGLPVFQVDEKSGNVVSSVVAKVENGYLKYYKHYLRSYDFSDKKTVQETMISAADALVERVGEDFGQMRISKAYECFVDMKGSYPEADWVFEIEGMDGLYR